MWQFGHPITYLNQLILVFFKKKCKLEQQISVNGTTGRTRQAK